MEHPIKLQSKTMQKVRLSDLVQSLFSLINRTRKDPLTLIPLLRQRICRFKDSSLFQLRENLFIETKQGTQLIYNLIEQLSHLKPIPELEWSPELHLVADELALQQSDLETTSIPIEKRVQKHCEWYGRLATTVQYGFGLPEEIFAEMLIDDGLPTRGNRRNILNTEFRYVGISANRQLKNQFKTVVVYATLVRPFGQEETARAACDCKLI